MYRILSIDGGGMHGYASVVLLKRLLNKYPNLIKNTDLITGTSIGGILGLGLAMNHPIDFVEDNFLQGIPLAFNTNCIQFATFLAGLGPKYDVSKFEKFLSGVYGKTTLNELNKKVVIPAFKLDNRRDINRRWQAKVFHNFDGLTGDPDAFVLEVAMATSAVPVFFPSYMHYIDGAFVANNPSLIAVTQALDKKSKIFPQPMLEDLAILSLGSIRDEYINGSDLDWGYLPWIKPMLQIATERDTLVVNHQCEVFFGDRYMRLEPVINGPMDNCDEIKSIKNIAAAYSIDNTVKWLERYW